MAKRYVMADCPSLGRLYIASVAADRFLTTHADQARRFHNRINARIAAEMWQRTLADLGFAAAFWEVMPDGEERLIAPHTG